jgi:hypothetical protein
MQGSACAPQHRVGPAHHSVGWDRRRRCRRRSSCSSPSTCKCRRRAGLKLAPMQQASFAALPLGRRSRCASWTVCSRGRNSSLCLAHLSNPRQYAVGAHSKSACTHYMHFNADPKMLDLMLQRHVVCCFRTSRLEMPGVRRGCRGGHQPPRRRHQGHSRTTAGWFGVQTMVRVISCVYSSDVQPLQP